MIAPLEALAPYKAAAVAPFSTVILSISSGLTINKLSPPSLLRPSLPPPPPFALFAPWLMGRPLITNKGALSVPLNPDCPRNRILVLDAGPADGGVISRPATLPSREAITLFVRFFCSSSTLAVVVEYPNSLGWRLIPKAVTTILSMLPASILMETFTDDRPFIGTSWIR